MSASLDAVTVSLKKPGTQQFGRKFSLIVADSTGQGLELGAFRCVFHIQRGDMQTPNSCDVRVYNLTRDLANSFAGPNSEFVQLAVQAGYPGNFGLIFRGGITQARIGRESQTDSYVDFTAADGDEAYNFATISSSLAAGENTPTAALEAIIDSMVAKAVTPGKIPHLTSNGNPRGTVYHGATRDELRIFAAENDLLWSIQDGVLTLIPQTSYVAGDVPTISTDTGLVGTPEQSQNGISMTVLLNPSIKIGQAVQLSNSVAINQYRYGLSLTDQIGNIATAQNSSLNKFGLYYVMRADHSGDTRGNEWYTNLVCLAIDATVTNLSSAGINAFQVAGVGAVARR